MPPATPNRLLAPKEATLFKELLTLYEARQLKKALKTADQILKKSPRHGETLSMKGLVMVHMGKRDEGIELVKSGMRFDLTSHIVWHVFGLIQKAEKKYDEALKSYTQAIKFDKDNMNLLRDTANLQAHLRMYDGLVESRINLLRLRPNMRQNWVALAGAYHLNGNLEEAGKTLEHYEEIIKEVPTYDVEYSEVLLYHIRILEGLGEYSKALAMLDSSAKSRSIVDRTAIMEQRARLTDRLDRPADAAEAWKALIHHNADLEDYYKGYLSSQSIDLENVTDDSRPEAIRILREFSEQLPRAGTPKRLLLVVSEGQEFSDLVKDYLQSGLRRGIPSLFVDVKALYSNTSKRDIIESTAEEFLAAQKPSTSVSSADGADTETPTTYIWTLYFLAQHHSYLDRQQKALSYIATALEHTPTLPDLLTLKARILKRAGDPFGAARNLNEARLLDGQDRFLNTKCGKYRLRAGLVAEASEIFGMFTKKDATSPGDDLREMQSLLFITEEAAAHERNGKFGLALKRYGAAQRTFDVFEDDQYDFHAYSFRRFNINVYMEMMTWADKLRSHPAYVASAVGAARIYVQLHDNPSLVTSASEEAAADEKKNKKKAKKAAKAQEDAKKAQSTPNEDKGLEPPTVKDEDSFGIQLLSVSDPLEQAARWLAPFQTLSIKNPDVLIATYDVAVRRNKFLQAAKALSSLQSLDADSPELHVRLVHFRKTVSSSPDILTAAAGPALKTVLDNLWPSEELSAEAFNSQYLQRRGSSGEAVLAVARASVVLGAPMKEAEDALFQVFDEHVELPVKIALSAVKFLEGANSSRTEEFRERAAQKFPLATVFSPPEEIARLRQAAVTNPLVEDGETEAIP